MAAPGPGGGATGSLLIFSPRSELNIYYISSSATATQSTGTAPIPANPLNTRLFYLGSGFGNAEAGGWYGSETSSYSGSFHNRLFWMYGNSTNFANEYSNLYYNTFQTMSTMVGGNITFGQGIVPFDINQLQSSPGNAAFISPPINAPSYNYQLIVSKSTNTNVDIPSSTHPNIITNWTELTQDSLRSGSGNTIFETSGQGYKGQFNTASGFYTFIRGNLPTASTTPVRAIPVEITLSIQVTGDPESGKMWNFHLVSGSNNTIIASFPSFFSGFISQFVDCTVSTSLNIYSGSANSAANLGNVAGGQLNGISLQITSSIPGQYRSASLKINQPLTGRQIAAEVPLINIFDVTNTPTPNDTGSYYVITPNLRGVDDVKHLGNSQLNYTFAVYYFKTAYHLWRDAWRVQAADGGPICPEGTWISASTNPSWAAYDIGDIVTAGPTSVPTRNAYGLYASRSGVFTFENYGIYSTDGAVRNRSYVGITAELLGGSELIKHLKANYAGTISASFPGNKFGGMIVVKASRVSTDSSNAANRYSPGTTTPPYPSTFIWYKPGNGNSSQTTIYNPGLPITEVNDGDVIPFSNFGYNFNTGQYSPAKSNMDWPSDIPWPPANPNVSNSFYGY